LELLNVLLQNPFDPPPRISNQGQLTLSPVGNWSLSIDDSRKKQIAKKKDIERNSEEILEYSETGLWVKTSSQDPRSLLGWGAQIDAATKTVRGITFCFQDSQCITLNQNRCQKAFEITGVKNMTEFKNLMQNCDRAFSLALTSQDSPEFKDFKKASDANIQEIKRVTDIKTELKEQGVNAGQFLTLMGQTCWVFFEKLLEKQAESPRKQGH
jgi:hypothetical protein